MSQQVRPPNGPHHMSGTGTDPDHEFEAAGNVGILDPGTIDEIHFAWDPVDHRYVSGDWVLYWFDMNPPPLVYLLVNFASLVVETGHWT